MHCVCRPVLQSLCLFQVVDAGSSSWCVLDQGHKTATSQQPPRSGGLGNGSSSSIAGKAPLRRVDKLLSLSLALPPPTEEEVMYKKGKPTHDVADVHESMLQASCIWKSRL